MKIQTTFPDKNKYYNVRSGDNLIALKKWMKWAMKNYKEQNFIIVNHYKLRMREQDKVMKHYWKARFRGGTEDKYIIYGTY